MEPYIIAAATLIIVAGILVLIFIAFYDHEKENALLKFCLFWVCVGSLCALPIIPFMWVGTQ